MTNLTSALTRHHIRAAVAQLGAQVWTVISAWPHYSVLGSCKEEVRVYWAQDDFAGGAALLGLSARVLSTREGRIAAAANFVVAANPLVADVWRDRGHDVALIPYGTDVDAYAEVDRAPPPPDVQLPPPVAGFVGQINDRMDIRLLEAIAERGRSLLLVGPRNPAFEPRRFDTLLRRRNVCWVGPKPFDELPSYLRSIDVGIVPYGDIPFNRGSFPLKTLEYLAAGRPVVATDLPAIRWLATDLVAIASDLGCFADHVDRMLAETRSPTLMAHRRAFAAQHSWANCAARFYDALLSRSHRAEKSA
jgi:glycosyltransferase involved in cell wall biosynthesis